MTVTDIDHYADRGAPKLEVDYPIISADSHITEAHDTYLDIDPA